MGREGLSVNSAVDPEADIRARLQQHWEASERGDVDAEHAIYASDAILDYPQSGERFRGRPRIQAQRGGHPAERHFTIRRIQGGGDLWVSECVITYDGVPTFSVSVTTDQQRRRASDACQITSYSACASRNGSRSSTPGSP